MPKCGGIIVCGGQSTRMGQPKARLAFGHESMLGRVVRLLSQAVSPIVVAAGKGDVDLPDLPPDAIVVSDRQAGRGPLEGLAVALAAMTQVSSPSEPLESAFVTSCDVPLLLPDFVRRVVELSAGYDVAVPCFGGYYEPLAAVYSLRVLPEIEQLLAAGERRPRALFDRVDTRRIEEDELSDVDPTRQSLANINSPADYRAALAYAGLEPPET